MEREKLMARIKKNPARYARARLKKMDQDDVNRLLSKLGRTWGIGEEFQHDEV